MAARKLVALRNRYYQFTRVNFDRPVYRTARKVARKTIRRRAKPRVFLAPQTVAKFQRQELPVKLGNCKKRKVRRKEILKAVAAQQKRGGKGQLAKWRKKRANRRKQVFTC